MGALFDLLSRSCTGHSTTFIGVCLVSSSCCSLTNILPAAAQPSASWLHASNSHRTHKKVRAKGQHEQQSTQPARRVWKWLPRQRLYFLQIRRQRRLVLNSQQPKEETKMIFQAFHSRTHTTHSYTRISAQRIILHSPRHTRSMTKSVEKIF